ncbi:MAG: DsrE family protein [Candidatus Rokuibacteriota bacterium]
MAPDTETPVLVVVSVDPEHSHRANEAVRIALGILAGENAVTVALLGAGSKVLDADVEDYVDGEDLARHLATLKKLGQQFHVERRAARSEAGWNPAGLAVIPIDRADLAGLLAGSRRTLVF